MWETENIVRVLTTISLGGLLLAVGMRLRARQVVHALRERHLTLIILANFAVVPVLVVTATRLCGLGTEVSTGMILLAAAPFAPVVPVFARMARADLALAAGLTALFPLLSVFLTPLVCQIALTRIVAGGSLQFNATSALLVLSATIVLPLCLGMGLNRVAPLLVRSILRRVEMASEAAGAASLAFVTATAWSSIVGIGWRALGVTAVTSEISLLLGYSLGGKNRTARQVVGLGTSNRNIALALLVALQAFGGTGVVPAVVANGLILILLGLIHVAFWRFGPQRGESWSSGRA